jgi:hypothetical protein
LFGFLVIGYAFEAVDNGEVYAQVFSEGVPYLLAFVQVHATVVDEDGMETISECFAYETGCYGGVHASADGSEDLVLGTYERLDALDFLFERKLTSSV